MMALKSPLMPSPTHLQSAFSPFSESPSSPAPYSSLADRQKRTSAQSDSLQPPESPYLDPSPVDSNGTASTDATEFEEEASGSKSPVDSAVSHRPYSALFSVASAAKSADLGKIDITSADRAREVIGTEPQSVIHVPSEFAQFSQGNTSGPPTATASPTEKSELTVQPNSPSERGNPPDKRTSIVGSLNTSVPSGNPHDHPTPRAQSIKDFGEGFKDYRFSQSLQSIYETDNDVQRPRKSRVTIANSKAEAETEQMITSLKNALSECWTLCNTLAGLSSNHRARVFTFQGKSEVQETAWRSCWKLCQNLYNSRDEDHITHVLPTLEMCRDFCQALFEARQRNPSTADVDSVLRVSFELNNHLYNTHDRKLPIAFQERTLEFYLTLCHRLMRQRTSLPEETDSLLRACWSLAEMLFSLRQNNREGKPADEELLGSAVQACWDLCDLFRDGWTQIRPERETPRATQNLYSRNRDMSLRKVSSPPYSEQSSRHSSRNYHEPKNLPPETPTTIFDDTNDDDQVEDDEAHVPHILVLGPDHHTSQHRWSSASSAHSGYSDGSSLRGGGASSTKTITQDDMNIARVHNLLLKAASLAGYQTSPPTSNTSTSSTNTSKSMHLPTFVKSIPSNSFGAAPWQVNLLDKYKKCIQSDPVFRPFINATSTTTSSSSKSKRPLSTSTSTSTPTSHSSPDPSTSKTTPPFATAAGAGAGANASTIDTKPPSTASSSASSASNHTTTNASASARSASAYLANRRVGSAEVARAVQWLVRREGESYAWLRDLFRLVFGGHVEEMAARGGGYV